MSSLQCTSSEFGLQIWNPWSDSAVIIDDIEIYDENSRRYVIGSFCIDSSVGADAGIQNGTCTNTGEPRWSRLCVGNDSSECSESAVFISFPLDLFVMNSMEGAVESSTGSTAISCSPAAISVRIYKYTHLDDGNKDAYVALLGAAVVCIVIPILISWVQLINEVRLFWWKDDVVKVWLVHHSKIR